MSPGKNGNNREEMSNDNHQDDSWKLAGLKAVSDARGVIAAAAMDQRGSLKKSLAKEKGVSDLPDSALVEFKDWSPRC